MPSEPGRRVSVISEQELKDAELLLGLKRKSMFRRRLLKKKKSKSKKSK